jgi:glycosyl transferase family 25
MKTYIIHVKTDLVREKNIEAQLEGKDLDIQFVLDGDMNDLTQDMIDSYFKGNMAKIIPQTSCGYKHLLAYQMIVDEDEDMALILEDDIQFYSNFKVEFPKIIQEIKDDDLTNFIISLEDSHLKYIERSKRVKNKRVYKKAHGRMAGAYLIDREACKNILHKIREQRTDLPIDWFHNLCSDNGVIDIYWAQPTIATQGSIFGSMSSIIDQKSTGVWRMLSFQLQRVYKKLLFNLR